MILYLRLGNYFLLLGSALGQTLLALFVGRLPLWLHVLDGVDLHRECENTALARFRLHCYCAAEALTYLLANAKAKSVPAHVHPLTLRLCGSKVGSENLLDLRLTYAYAKVFNRHP